MRATMTSRVVAGLAACLARGLLFFASTAGASPGLVKYCAGNSVASRTGIRLVGADVRVTSTAYNADEVRLYAARPELRCGTALQVVNAYLAAKLDRPDGRDGVVRRFTHVEFRETDHDHS